MPKSVSFGGNLATAPAHLDPKVLDLLAQGVAVKPQDLRRPYLVAPGAGESQGDEGTLDLLKDTVMQTSGRVVLVLVC